MNAFAPYLAALHIEELREEARLQRRAALSERAYASVPAWRRGLGTGARGLSGLFASAARSLDPSVEAERAARRSHDGRVGRALAS
jgi:hypothetical protein